MLPSSRHRAKRMDPPLPLERFAALSAELQAGAPRDEVLAREGLSLETWSEIQQAWTTRLAEEAAQGRIELSSRFSAALVAGLEAATLRAAPARVVPPGAGTFGAGADGAWQRETLPDIQVSEVIGAAAGDARTGDADALGASAGRGRELVAIQPVLPPGYTLAGGSGADGSARVTLPPTTTLRRAMPFELPAPPAPPPAQVAPPQPGVFTGATPEPAFTVQPVESSLAAVEGLDDPPTPRPFTTEPQLNGQQGIDDATTPHPEDADRVATSDPGMYDAPTPIPPRTAAEGPRLDGLPFKPAALTPEPASRAPVAGLPDVLPFRPAPSAPALPPLAQTALGGHAPSSPPPQPAAPVAPAAPPMPPVPAMSAMPTAFPFRAPAPAAAPAPAPAPVPAPIPAPIPAPVPVATPETNAPGSAVVTSPSLLEPIEPAPSSISFAATPGGSPPAPRGGTMLMPPGSPAGAAMPTTTAAPALVSSASPAPGSGTGLPFTPATPMSAPQTLMSAASPLRIPPPPSPSSSHSVTGALGAGPPSQTLPPAQLPPPQAPLQAPPQAPPQAFPFRAGQQTPGTFPAAAEQTGSRAAPNAATTLSNTGVTLPASLGASTPRLTLEQFASLSAEMAVSPGAAAQVRARYGLDELSHTAEQGIWQRRFSADRDLFTRYSALFQSYREWLSKTVR